MSTLHIRLLGEFQVLRDGRAEPLPQSRKTRALLAYLVLTAKPERRERLCDLLWDGPNDPRAALRWSLTKLRELVDDADVTRLVADRERVAFEPHGATLDVHELRTQLGAGADAAPTNTLGAAAPLLRDELLAGLDLPDCYAYSAWLASERDALRRLRLDVLSTLVRRTSARPEEALAWAREHVAADPFSDAAHASVIELLNALGRVHEARDAYDEVRRVMRRELSREPGVVVDRARTRIEDAVVPAAPRSGAAPTLLVGRDDELAVLRDEVSRARGGAPCDVLLVTGEPGIGKSRLLEELGALATSAGGVVLHGRAFEAEMIRPYGPWIDALRALFTDPSRAAVGAAMEPRLLSALGVLVPELTGAQSQPAVVVDRAHLFDAVVSLLGALGRTTAPVVVALDDLQWFDDASLALLHFVVRASGTRGVIVALSARPNELAARTPAASLVRALRRESPFRELALEPLSPGDIATLTSRLYQDVDVAQVTTASEGNPLFALEVARNLAAGKTDVPKTLEAIIDERLARLSAGSRELVTWAAALGASFTPRALGGAAALADGELLAAMEELELHGIVRQAANDVAYDFSHDLIRQVAYARMSRPRARAVHLAIAQRLSAVDDPKATLAGDVAAHALLGGDPVLAANACIRAADRCARMFALVEAQALARRGLDALASATSDAAPPPRERIPLEVALYRALLHAGGARGRESETQQALDRVADEARSYGLHAQMQAAFYLVSYIHFSVGDWALAEADTRRAVEAGRAAGDATAVRSLANSGRCLAAIERDLPLAAQLLDEGRVGCASLGLDLVDLPWGYGILAHYRGDADEAATQLERAAALARARDAHWPLCDCLVRLAAIELERGRFAAARAHCADVAPVAAKLGDSSEKPLAAAIDALATIGLAAEGESSEAHERLRSAIAELAQIDAKGARSYVLVAAAYAKLTAGSLDDASRLASEALAASETVGRRSEAAMARTLLARAAFGRGDMAQATAYLETVVAVASLPDALSARALEWVAALRRDLSDATSTQIIWKA